MVTQRAKVLMDAITGESGAVAKYLRYGQIAQQEGLLNVAYLFYALVAAEQIHIKNHSNALGKDFRPQIKTAPEGGGTLVNLRDAIESELYEHRKMYPQFLKAIKKERKAMAGKVAALSLEWARDVELSHAEALKVALKAVEGGRDLEVGEIWVCKVCGNLVLGGKPTENCPVCKHDPHFYELIARNGGPGGP